VWKNKIAEACLVLLSTVRWDQQHGDLFCFIYFRLGYQLARNYRPATWLWRPIHFRHHVHSLQLCISASIKEMYVHIARLLSVRTHETIAWLGSTSEGSLISAIRRASEYCRNIPLPTGICIRVERRYEILLFASSILTPWIILGFRSRHAARRSCSSSYMSHFYRRLSDDAAETADFSRQICKDTIPRRIPCLFSIFTTCIFILQSRGEWLLLLLWEPLRNVSPDCKAEKRLHREEEASIVLQARVVTSPLSLSYIYIYIYIYIKCF